MREGTISARLYTAAYLAALTINNGWRLVSFDHVFKHFGALQRLTLRSGLSSGQPTLIQLSDGLKFRILMEQRKADGTPLFERPPAVRGLSGQPIGLAGITTVQRQDAYSSLLLLSRPGKPPPYAYRNTRNKDPVLEATWRRARHRARRLARSGLLRCRGKKRESQFGVSIVLSIRQEPRCCSTTTALTAKGLHRRCHHRHHSNRTVIVHKPLQALRRTQGKALANCRRDHGLATRSNHASQSQTSELPKI